MYLAIVQTRVPNVNQFTYEEHATRRRLKIFARRAPDPIRPHEASPPKHARMPITVFYDPMKQEERAERMTLTGAHTRMEMGASAPRGRMVGDINRRSIRRNLPRAYGNQVEEIGGE
jgi:hypothetical protein